MNDNRFEIICEIYVSDDIAVKMDVELRSSDMTIKRLINTEYQNDNFAYDYLFDYSSIEPDIKDFILYFKRFTQNLIYVENNKKTLEPPFDYYLIKGIMQFDNTFVVKGTEKDIELSREIYKVKYRLDPIKKKIYLTVS